MSCWRGGWCVARRWGVEGKRQSQRQRQRQRAEKAGRISREKSMHQLSLPVTTILPPPGSPKKPKSRGCSRHKPHPTPPHPCTEYIACIPVPPTVPNRTSLSFPPSSSPPSHFSLVSFPSRKTPGAPACPALSPSHLSVHAPPAVPFGSASSRCGRGGTLARGHFGAGGFAGGKEEGVPFVR